MDTTQRTTEIHEGDAEAATRVPARPPKAISQKSILLILIAALLVNAVIVLVGLPMVSHSLLLTYSMNFGDLYDLIARNLDQGNGYRVDAYMSPTMLREPAYPLLLAAAFKLGGYSIQTARVACVLLAFGSALLLFMLARKITSDEMTALAAALLFLLYPGTLVAEARAGIEMPFIFTVLLFMLAFYSAVEKGSLWRYGAAGLLLGVAVMVRSQALLFPLVLFVYLVFISKSMSERMKFVPRFALLGLGAMLVMSPWIIRNYGLVHKLVPSATVAGVAAQEGLYTCEIAPASESFFQAQTNAGLERERFAKQLGLPSVGSYYQLFYTPQDEVAFNQALLRSASTEYRSHPEVLARCATKNLFFNFWFLGKRHESTLLNLLAQIPLLGLALAGVVILWKRSLLHKAAIVLLYIVYVPAVQAPIIAHARHSIMIVPFLAILGAVSLVSAWRTLRMQNSGAPYPRAVAKTS